jgi:hypothetical protein
MITENTTNDLDTKKMYDELVRMVKEYSPITDIETICVHRTEKGNWAVYDEDHEMITIAPKNMLAEEMFGIYNIKTCDPSIAYNRVIEKRNELLQNTEETLSDGESLVKINEKPIEE